VTGRGILQGGNKKLPEEFFVKAAQNGHLRP